ncbi:hypothetical protein NM208_g10874 [Fusarium decemcellulare]|uniref:Uncharacterized protein n=1 Tax=Fusarium decemcellulare TaxID=57161 RepID=A0ACC1RWB8_9HYPO|nr:hypothetical protein NM208_g10874 [Fusarium decemcellulare]
MAGNPPPGRHRRTRNRIMLGRRDQNPSPYRRRRRPLYACTRASHHGFLWPPCQPRPVEVGLTALKTPRILALSATERDEVNSERGDSGSVQTTPEVTAPEDLPVGYWKTNQPKCQTCDGAQHATRHCPKSQEDAISEYADEAITANDLIIRNCLVENSVHTDGGKRVKKNKATRARELAMPPTAKSNANLQPLNSLTARTTAWLLMSKRVENDESVVKVDTRGGGGKDLTRLIVMEREEHGDSSHVASVHFRTQSVRLTKKHEMEHATTPKLKMMPSHLV